MNGNIIEINEDILAFGSLNEKNILKFSKDDILVDKRILDLK